jgi:Cu/Ag efflux pump CusA
MALMRSLLQWPSGSKNGTPVLLRDLGTVSFGPDIREGVAEWNGEGETVGGIIVMRQGVNALNVINGVKQKFCYVPKHTVGEQLLQVREAKREQAAYESATLFERDP